MFFFFNDTATTEIYTLSLHDALPICYRLRRRRPRQTNSRRRAHLDRDDALQLQPAASCRAGQSRCPRGGRHPRSEEHTSELQSRQYLVCRLLLEKKKKLTTQ